MPDFLLFVRKLFPLRSKNISSEEEKKSSLWGFRWVLGERKFRLMNQRDMEKLNEDYHTEKYLRHQQIHETLDLLALFEKPDTAKLVREVAVALMGTGAVLTINSGAKVLDDTGAEIAPPLTAANIDLKTTVGESDADWLGAGVPAAWTDNR